MGVGLAGAEEGAGEGLAGAGDGEATTIGLGEAALGASGLGLSCTGLAWGIGAPAGNGLGDPMVGKGWKKKLPLPGAPGVGEGGWGGLAAMVVGTGLGVTAEVGLGVLGEGEAVDGTGDTGTGLGEASLGVSEGLAAEVGAGFLVLAVVGAGLGNVKGAKLVGVGGWVGLTVVGLNAVNGLDVGGNAEGVGAGVGEG